MRVRFAFLVGIPVVVGFMMLPVDSTLSHVTTTNTVMFDREIVSMLNAHCVGCHGAEGLAPPLVTYEETWLSRNRVYAEVLRRHMPPWGGVSGYGKFSNDNGLTSRETQFLVSWVEGLGPRNDGAVFLNVGDPGDAPVVVRASADRSEWVLGEPDQTLRVPEIRIGPEQGDRIERVRIPTGFDSDVWVGGFEYRPGDRRVVRAVTVWIVDTGQWLGSWTPWHGYLDLPESTAIRVPAGSALAAEIYYQTTDEATTDSGVLGLFLADPPGERLRIASDLVLETRGDIPPETVSVRFQTEADVDSDFHAFSLLPQFESGILSIEVSVRRPDGGTDILLFARDIPIGWPTPFILEDPVLVAAGSRVRVTAYYENTSSTPQPGGIRLTLSGV